MDKYLLIFNAGYNFTAEAKKMGIRIQIMSLPEVLQYEKQAKDGFLTKRAWEYGEKFESDVRQLFANFRARVVGIAQKDLEKTQKAGLKVETPNTQFFILDPWDERNETVEKYFPQQKMAAATVVKKVEPEKVDEGKPPEGLVNIRDQGSSEGLVKLRVEEEKK